MSKKNTDEFWKLLDELKILLAGTWGEDEKQCKEKFSRLFLNNPLFTKRVYSHLGIAGAAISVADVLTRRPRLMQSQDKDTEARDFLTIDLPFLPRRTSNEDETKFSSAIHDLFVQRREEQELRVSTSETFRGTEYLQHLPTGFQPPKDDEEALDRIYCPVGEVLCRVAIWRWALYMCSRRSFTETISDIKFDDVWNKPPRVANCFYGDKIFFGHGTDEDQTTYADRLAEAWMLEGPGEDQSDPVQRVRRNCDAVSRKNTFVADGELLGLSKRTDALTELGKRAWNSFEAIEARLKTKQKASAPQTIREFAERIHDFCQKEEENQGKPLIHLLAWIHSMAQFPVFPYYYLIVLDKGPKEHFVFPVLRSREFPVGRSQQGGEADNTTCAAVALFSLNDIRGESDLARNQRLLEIEAFFKILAQRILDQAFYGRIQRELNRQKADRRRTRITLHDLDWATGSFLTNFDILPAQCQAAAVYLEFLRRFLRGSFDKAEITKGPWKEFSSWFEPGRDRHFTKLAEKTFLAGYYRAQPSNAIPRRPKNGDATTEWSWDEMWKFRDLWLDWECNLPGSWSWLDSVTEVEKIRETLQIHLQFWILNFLISSQKHSIHYAFRHADVVQTWSPAPSTVRKAAIRVKVEPKSNPRRILISNLGNPPSYGGQSVSEAIPGEHSQEILASMGSENELVQWDNFCPSKTLEPGGGVWWTGCIRINQKP